MCISKSLLTSHTEIASCSTLNLVLNASVLLFIQHIAVNVRHPVHEKGKIKFDYICYDTDVNRPLICVKI